MKSILLIEDDPSILRLMQTVLTNDRKEYSTTAVTSGTAGIERLERQTFDLVITDENLPGAKGNEVARWMRLQPRHRHVPIIMTSAEHAHHLFSDLLRQQIITFYLPKPFSIVQFESLVGLALNMKVQVA